MVLLLLLLLPPASAGPPEPGERLTWSARWMGARAGEVWAEVGVDGDHTVVTGGGRSADWLASLYPVEDRLRSVSAAGLGSVAFTGTYREGRFHEDLSVTFAPPWATVDRRNEVGDKCEASATVRCEAGWRHTVDQVATVPLAEDPLSAIYRVRASPPAEGERLEFPVFDGRRIQTLRVTGLGDNDVDGRPARRVRVENVGTKSKMSVLLDLSADPDAIPLRVTLPTGAGPVTLLLEGRVDPSP